MNINTTYTSAFSSNKNQQNLQSKTIPENKDRTIIQSKNDWESESDKRKKILDKKYSKIHEQNKQFKDPQRHIVAKYIDTSSPYFRSDLTKDERDAAYMIEMSWAKDGKGGYYSSKDAAFRDKTHIDESQDFIGRKVFNRQKVNEQLHALFSKNGITIPNETSLTFTIDPNNFKLVVSGSKDESLINQLENILNTDNNSKELFFHIMQSRSDDSTQFTPKSLEKFHLVNQIKNVTGYHLKDLEIVNGKFVTENGTNIFDIYKEALLKNPYTARHVGIATSYYGSQLYELAKNGFNSMPDLVLSIGYQNDSLQDLGQKENYGSNKTY